MLETDLAARHESVSLQGLPEVSFHHFFPRGFQPVQPVHSLFLSVESNSPLLDAEVGAEGVFEEALVSVPFQEDHIVPVGIAPSDSS